MNAKRKWVVLSIVSGVSLLIAGSVGYWWAELRFRESTDNAFVQSDISIVSPRVAGYLRDVAVQDNQRVKAGQVLAVIDDRDFHSHVAEARGQVEAARAAIANIDSRLASQRAMIESARATVTSADAEATRSAKDFARYEALLPDGFVSKKNFDLARAEMNKAKAALEKSRADYAAQKSQTSVLDTERARAEGQLQEAEAAFKLAEDELADTVIRSPIDGVVGNRSAQTGQYVRAGTQLLAVVPLPVVYVVANFKETQIARMRVGQPAEIRIDAFGDTPLTGHVESFSPASGAEFTLLPTDNATGNFTKIVQRLPVRIAVPADNRLNGWLRPGLSVAVTVDTRDAKPVEVAAGEVFGVREMDSKAAANRSAISEPAAAVAGVPEMGADPATPTSVSPHHDRPVTRAANPVVTSLPADGITPIVAGGFAAASPAVAN